LQLLLQNHCLLSHQTYHNCSSRGSEEILYLFEAIRNPRWLPWHLICQDILISSPELLHMKSPNMTEMFLLRSLRSAVVFHIVLKSNMAAPVCDWLIHYLLFSKTTPLEVTWLAIAVPLMVLKKNCYFLEWFEIQDGRPVLWLDKTVFTSFPEKLHAKSPDILDNVSLGGSSLFFLWRNLISAIHFFVSSDMINYKFIYVHIMIWWGFSMIDDL